MSPAATEICDEIDNDCDGEIDEGVTTTFTEDVDSDGYGGEGATVEACEAPSGYAAPTGDCDDENSDVWPGATELCDAVDEGVTDTFSPQGEGDGRWGAGAPVEACEAPSGYAPLPGDCDDAEPTANPDGEEDCGSGVDEDCDGLVDCEDGECAVACTEDCDSGADEDMDGLVDCADEDCWYDPACGGEETLHVRLASGSGRATFYSYILSSGDQMEVHFTDVRGTVSSFRDSVGAWYACTWTVPELTVGWAGSYGRDNTHALGPGDRPGVTVTGSCAVTADEFLPHTIMGSTYRPDLPWEAYVYPYFGASSGSAVPWYNPTSVVGYRPSYGGGHGPRPTYYWEFQLAPVSFDGVAYP